MLALAIWSQPREELGGRVKLVWASDNNPSRADQIAAFNRESPQDRLELDYGNIGMEKILLQCSSGIGPDIFDIYSDELQTYAESGVLWDVTDPAKSNGILRGEGLLARGGRHDHLPGPAVCLSLQYRDYGSDLQ